MYSLSIRINSIFFYFGVCLALLGAFNIATTFFLKGQPKVKYFKYTPTSLYLNQYTKVQHANGILNFDIDFEPCYNWNTNLVFAWISATYRSEKKGSNKPQYTTVTIWDNIMKRDKPLTHQVVLKNETAEYPLIDANKNLNGKQVELVLHWEHMPVIGPILKKSIPLINVTLLNSTTSVIQKTTRREYDYVNKADR